MSHDRDDLAEARAAEHGYNESSLREVRLRDWYSGRDDPRKDGEFQRLAHQLVCKRWRAENPEASRAAAAAWADRNPEKVAEYRRRYEKKRRRKKLAARKAIVYTCAAPDCAATWCRVPWRRALSGDRHFCSQVCYERARYHEDPDYRRQEIDQRRKAQADRRKERGLRRDIRCTVCRQTGHNRATCPQSKATAGKRALCSICQEPGHNKRTCPRREP